MTNRNERDAKETKPVPAAESARIAQAELEFKLAATREAAYQMTAFYRALGAK